MKNFENTSIDNIPKFILDHFGLFVYIDYAITNYNQDGSIKSFGKAQFMGHIYSYSENNIIILSISEHNPSGNLIEVDLEIFKKRAEIYPIPKDLTQFHAYLYRRMQQQYYDYSTKS